MLKSISYQIEYLGERGQGASAARLICSAEALEQSSFCYLSLTDGPPESAQQPRKQSVCLPRYLTFVTNF